MVVMCAVLGYRDGTAKGGASLKTGDYITLSGQLHFKHRETKKTLCIHCSETKVISYI